MPGTKRCYRKGGEAKKQKAAPQLAAALAGTGDVGRDGLADAEAALDAGDDYASKWQECLDYGKEWGGAGYGGRGQLFMGSENLDIDNVSLQYLSKDGTVQLLTCARLVLRRGTVYGLVGANGSGKTTLLRRMARHKLPGMPLLMTVAYVAQESADGGEDSRTPVQCCLDADVQRRFLEHEIAEISGNPERANDAEKLPELMDAWVAIEADEAEEKAEKMLQELGFSEAMMARPVSTLSGGWRSKLDLAKAFLSRPNLLLLDEPTNHLDFRAQALLKRYIRDRQDELITIIVSHDADFLDELTTSVIHLDHHQKTLVYFAGNYSGYLEKVGFRLQAASAKAEKAAKEADRLREQAAKMKGSKDETKNAAAKNMERRAERTGMYKENGKKFKQSYCDYENVFANLASQLHKDREIRFKTVMPGEVEGELLSVEGAEFSYGDDKVLTDVTVRLDQESRPRVAIVGDNGSGKTTLLKGIMKIFAAEDCAAAGLEPCPTLRVVGRRARCKAGVRAVYLGQHHLGSMNERLELTAVEYFREVTGFEGSDQEVFGFLGSYGLAPALHRRVGALSGGQRAKLCLGVCLWARPHVVFLDEPTNHLDRAAMEALTAAMKDYPGAVVVVSHCREFLRGMCTQLWSVANGKVKVSPVAQAPEEFTAMLAKAAKGG